MANDSKLQETLRELAPQRLRLAAGEVVLALVLTGLALVVLLASLLSR